MQHLPAIPATETNKPTILLERVQSGRRMGGPVWLAAVFLLSFLSPKVYGTVADSLKERLSLPAQHDTVRFKLLLNISKAYYTGSSDSMLLYARAGLALAEKIGKDGARLSALSQMSQSHMQAGNNDSAMYYAHRTLSLAKKSKLERFYAPALNQVGNVNFRAGNQAAALKYYDSAGKIAGQTGDSVELATAINNVAGIQYEQGDYIAALENYITALEMNERLAQTKNVETGLLNVTNIFFRLKDFDKAQQYGNRAMKMANVSGSHWSVISLHTTFAMIYNEQKKYDSSLRALQEAMKHARAINSPYLINLLEGNMAECYLNMDSLDKSYELYSNSLKKSAELDDLLGVAIARGGIGQILARRGDKRRGAVYMEEALDMLRAHGLKEQAMIIADTLANFYALGGDYRNAYKYYRIKDAYADSLAKDQSLADAQRVAYNYELHRKEDKIALLEKEKMIERAQADQQQILLVSALAGMLLALAAAVIISGNLRRVRKRNEVILSQKKEIEQQAERLEQLNRFKDTTFSVLSHDLRSPINALTGTMAMLDEGIITPEEFTAYKGELNIKLQSVTLMLDNLLLWARSQMKGEHTLDIERINVRRNVLRVFAVLKDPANQKNISLATDVGEQLYVSADKTQVEMVLRNLVSNAIKFTPPGGRVFVSAKKEDGRIHIAVTDTGVGMTQEQVDNLFSGESTASTPGTSGEKGTGIGLMLSYNFVKNNGGDVIVNSEPGKGTSFWVTLPAVNG